jgi:hypothetical protein
MEHVKNIACEDHDVARAHFQDGLRRAFEITHDPLPATMARLLQALRDKEEIETSH